MKKLLLFALPAALLATFLWYRAMLGPVDPGSSQRISVTIDPGTSTAGIAGLLQEKGVIRSAGAFRFYVRLNGLQGSLQAGRFLLQPSDSVPEIASTLSTGRAEEFALTIPEGYTVTQIDALLAEQGLIDRGAFTDCARACALDAFDFLPSSEGLAPRGGRVEGYLYPDTYFVASGGFDTEDFLERLLTTFRTRVIDALGGEIGASDRTLHEIVTMASLIEEEAITDEERPMISGILWKRFDDDRGLGVDATVRYILDKPTDTITAADLNVQSPYNTRKFRGLPPGPIANPGLASIEAALRPQASSYWYYLHGTDGTIHYAETNEEHNMNRYRYIRGGNPEEP